MYHVIAFLIRKPGTTFAAFKDYYENHHIPLIVSLSGDTLPTIYKRRYIDREDPASVVRAAEDGAEPRIVDFDAMTELVFEDLDAYKAWGGAIGKNADKVVEDEGRFLDRGRTRAHVVEEFVTKG